ncbi:HlyD family type I secretion periplasmic adaptor subunit [Kiloniella litopenaei]|uniref:HlyD family type I secretion periplasmic adaptor subunit n=1 Tax=Kiloniella litopenaei TaxID=1549748 RepID=UPI003BA9154C
MMQQQDRQELWSEKLWAGSSRYVLTGLLTVATLVIGLGGWSVMASISGAVIATGVVIVEGKPKTIQHLDGGLVGEILVKDGDSVKAGDVLVRLDETMVQTNFVITENRLYEAYAQRERLIAERDGKETVEIPPQFKALPEDAEEWQIHRDHINLFQARENARKGQVSQLRKRITQSGNEISGLRGLRKSKKQQVDFIAQELAGLRKLYEKGHATLPRLLALEREAAKLDGEISELVANIARAENQIGEAELQILQVEQDYRERALTELKETNSSISELEEQKIAYQEQLARVEIKAPVDGIIHGSSIFTVGGVVSPAEPLMQIVPFDERLTVEAQVDPQNVDQVYSGQPAVVKFPAFNQKVTPELNGYVLKVSPDRLQDPQSGIPYYQGIIEIPEEEMARLSSAKLVPGMPAEVYIQTGERSALSYLVKPLTDSLDKAFREE